MSTLLTRKGADYSANARKFIPPVTAGLQGWWYLGSLPGDDATAALTRTTKNLAGTTYSMAATGGPTISSGFVTVDSTHTLDTTVPETLDFSWVMLAQPLGISAKLGGYWATGSKNTQIIANGTTFTTAQAFSPRDTGGGTTAQVNCGSLVGGAGWTGLHVLSFKVSGTVSAFRDITTATTATPGVFTTARALAGIATGFQFGGAGGNVQQWKVGFLAIYNRMITDAEGDSIRQFVAKYRLAKYGDVV